MAALMRRLMSLDTSVMRRSGCCVRSASAVIRIELSGLLPGSTSGSEASDGRVWKNSLPEAALLSFVPGWDEGRGRPCSIIG